MKIFEHCIWTAITHIAMFWVWSHMYLSFCWLHWLKTLVHDLIAIRCERFYWGMIFRVNFYYVNGVVVWNRTLRHGRNWVHSWIYLRLYYVSLSIWEWIWVNWNWWPYHVRLIILIKSIVNAIHKIVSINGNFTRIQEPSTLSYLILSIHLLLL